MKNFMNIFRPYGKTTTVQDQLILAFFLGVLVLLWCFPPSRLIPTPWQTMHGLGHMWMEDGLSRELWTSLTFVVMSLGLATGLSLIIAYLTVLPVGRPPARFLEMNRYLGISGLPFLFAVVIHDIVLIKLSLMVFFMTVWFVTAMNETVRRVTMDELNYARTLGMGPWRVVWEMVILGNADKAWTTVLQINGMGWIMLAPLEQLNRGAGGIGVLIEVKKRTGDYDQLLALIVVYLVMAVLFDRLLRLGRDMSTPWASLEVSRI